jgi:hypothetical protein
VPMRIYCHVNIIYHNPAVFETVESSRIIDYKSIAYKDRVEENSSRSDNLKNFIFSSFLVVMNCGHPKSY